MLIEHQAAFILFFALVLDAALGDPDWLWRRYPHPAVMMGWLVGRMDQAFNRSDRELVRRIAGVLSLAVLIALAAVAAILLDAVLAFIPFGSLIEIAVVAILLAQRSLHDHVRHVYDAFAEGQLPSARRAVALIVGRDPESLDEAGVSRAAIETTAENFSDGVVAPAFWYLVAGLPGILIYKAVNTADSMIGYRTPRHKAFGWASARLDDLLNLIPARLCGLLIVAAAFLTRADGRQAWAAMMTDARNHRSPNAGWPEAAMAGALGLALAGPRHYASGTVDDFWMNDGGRDKATPEDIKSALRLFIVACVIQAGVIGAIAAFTV